MTPEEHVKNLKGFISHFEDMVAHNGFGDVRFDKEQAEKDIETFKFAIQAIKQCKEEQN